MNSPEKSIQDRIDAINANVQKKNEEAEKLLEYLKVQRTKAHIAEEQEEEELKRQGIIIGQHVPSLPSKLAIEHDEVQQFDNFASTLLIARDLVGQNRDNFLRRTGNRPISDLAETKRLQNDRRRAETVDDAPNYTQLTNSAKFRDDRVKSRFSNTLSESREMVQTRRLEMSLTAEKQKPLKRKKVLNAEERIANEDILKSINHKLNYLRNPRNDPAGVTKMLVKSKAQVERGGEQPEALLDDHASAATGRSAASGKSAATGKSGGASTTAASSAAGSKATKKRYGKPEKLDSNPLFVAEPSMIFFSNYDVGGSYKQTISFRNVSAVTRTLRVTAPKNFAFGLSPLRFPANCRGGMVAPGMSVTATITFTPTTLNDFVSSLSVETESGSIEIPLSAQREPPNLSIPSFLDVGCVLVGDAQRLSVTCANSGGGGKFRLLTQAQNERYERETAAAAEALEKVAAAAKLTGRSVADTSKSIMARSIAAAGGSAATVATEGDSAVIRNARDNFDDDDDDSDGDPGMDMDLPTGEEDSWQVAEGEEEQDAVQSVGSASEDGACLRMAPFTVYPVEFTLMKGESVDINIEFVPLELRRYETTFFMQCDNGQVRKFNLFGESKQISTSITAINDVEFDPSDAAVFPDMCFAAAHIGSEQSQKLVVVNDTGLPIEFEWVFIDRSITALGDIDQAARTEVYERERHAALSNSVLRIDSSPSRDESPAVANAAAIAAEIAADNLHPGAATAAAFDSSSYLASPEKRRLLKSLQMTMQGDHDHATSAHMTNAVESDGFEIRPARGVLPGEGAETFAFSFSPRALALTGKRAVMVIKSIPAASLPSPQQLQHLQLLATAGHGTVLRCRSWIEEIGIPAAVEEYIKPNSLPSQTKNLINFQTLIHLVLNHVVATATSSSSSVDAKEFSRISRWARELLLFVENLRKIDAAPDDGSSIGAGSIRSLTSSVDVVPTVDGNSFWLQCYDWQPTADGSGCDAPQLLPPLKVYRDVTTPDDDDHQHGNSSNGNRGDNGSHGSGSSNHDSQSLLRDFNTAQRALLNEVWLDVATALAVLGPDICKVLDAKVKHECVDYIKECALMHMAALSISVFGEGKRQRITALPPVVEVGGTLSMGRFWQGAVQLVNPSATTVEVDLLINELHCQRFYSAVAAASAADDFDEAENTHRSIAAADSEYSPIPFGREQHHQQQQQMGTIVTPITPRETQELVKFEPEHNRILVMPLSTVSIKFSVQLNAIGKFQITVPMRARSALTVVDDLVLRVQTTGPRLRFHDAEVDLGLIGVGSDGAQMLTFTNESDVPAMFMLKPQLHLDFSAGKSSQNGSDTQRSNRSSKLLLPPGAGGSESRQNTHRGDLSRMSSARTDDFSVADSQASSNGDFKIELKNAVVTIDPPSGVVLPQQTCTVSIQCKAGKIPQRIRGLIESRVCDEFGRVESVRQFLNMRGEVQAPKTKMYPLLTTLGQVYVGRPVQFSISIENMCNLPTMYKLLRPGGESAMYRLKFDRHKGPLGAKETVTVQCTFTALAVGMIDDIISNKIFGVKVPLAFEVKATSKGVALEFAPLADDEQPLQPLAAPTAVQLPGDARPPEARPITPLLLGDAVPLYKRRNVRFCIRNLSAIAVPFSLRARKFNVQEKKLRFASSQSQHSAAAVSTARSSLERTDLLLAPHEGGMEKFHSAAGKEYLGATVYRKEDRDFLHSGLGAAYHIDVLDGELEPWGVQVVTVSAYNDIPGCYDDEIECSIRAEGGAQRCFLLPVKMNVVGCPLVLDCSTVGMTKVHHTSAHSELIGRPLLHLGHTCVNAEPLVRDFFVRNHGSKDGKIRWHAQSVTSHTNGPLKLSLSLQPQLDENSGQLRVRVRPLVQFWEDVVKDSPFSIEPKSAVIPPYGKKKFTVTLFRTDLLGAQLAELTGAVKFSGSDNGNGSALSAALSATSAEDGGDNQSVASGSSSSSSSVTAFTIKLLAQGDFIHPTVVLEKHSYTADSSSTSVCDELALIMKAKAPLLFSKGAKPADLCNKSVTVSNPTDAKLLFSVSTEGPYSIREITPTITDAAATAASNAVAASSAPTSARFSDIDGGQSPRSQATALTAASKSSIGKMYHLFPNENGTFQIAFNPKRDLREKLLSQFGSEAGMPTEQRGSLVLSYSTGQRLRVPLLTRISTPFLAGSSPRLYFGVCRVSRSCDGVLLLRNPTDVPARWSVSHVAGQGAWRRSTAIRVSGFESSTSTAAGAAVEGEVDDPTVFDISPHSGEVQGPTVSTTAAMAAPPVDVNRRADTIVQQRTVKTSWALNTLTMRDSLEQRHKNTSNSLTATTATADACYPLPLTVRFTPKQRVRYSSRFRFSCEFANSFDVVLQGEGTFEEHLHKPLQPMPPSH